MWQLHEYRYARSVAEAVSMLRRGPGRGRYIAGGTDLLAGWPQDCDFVVDINGAGLGEIARLPEGDLFLGATASLQRIAGSSLVKAYAGGAVAEAALHCGNRPIRTIATLGGNLCHAVPSADMVPLLLALDASARIGDGETVATVSLTDFFVGPRQTVLEDRLLLGVSLPAASAGWQATSRKLKRSAEDISLAHVAVALSCRTDCIAAARIALGAVAPTPLRAVQAEQLLAGLDLAAVTPDKLREVGEVAAAASRPISDHRASAAYRRAMVAVLTGRLIGRLLQAGEGVGP